MAAAVSWLVTVVTVVIVPAVMFVVLASVPPGSWLARVNSVVEA